MPTNLPRVIAVACRGASLTLLGIFITPAAQAQHDAALAHCRSMSDSLKRLVCYDELADRAATNAVSSAAAPSAPAPATPTAAAPAAAPAAPANASSPAANAAFGLTQRAERREEPKTATYTLERVGETADRKLMMVATDGSVWVQTEGRRVMRPPQPGTVMEIERGALGGYFCKPEQHTAMRCRRVDTHGR